MIAVPVAVAALLIASPEAIEVRGAHAGVNGVKLYYEVRGSGSPVVLLHGGLNTIETSFSKVLPDLARRYKVVAIEQRGHGHTADSDGPLAYARMADDTAALLRHLDLGRADLVGWSDGGIIALLVASGHPQLVRRVVVSGVNTRLDGLPADSVKWLRETTADGLVKVLRKELREAYDRAAPDGPAHWPIVVAKVRELWLSPVTVEKAQLAAIEAPVLVIAGDQDRFATPEHSVEIFRSLRRAQLWLVPGTGHDTFNARPSWLLPVIADFLDAPEKPAK